MAKFQIMTAPTPVEIHEFFGINEAVDQTDMRLGESVLCENFRISMNMKPTKRDGYGTFIDYANAARTRVWIGDLDGFPTMVTTNNGNIYAKPMPDGANALIGTATFTNNVFFFHMNDVLYIWCDGEYFTYDGTTFAAVDPKVPVVTIETPPAGGGTLFEELNILTRKREQWFVGDNATTIYQTASTDWYSTFCYVEIDGVEQTLTTDYTISPSTGQVTFTTAPAQDADVRIRYEVGDVDITEIKKCRYGALSGVATSNTLFLWGNPDQQNRRYRSYVLDPTYFPANNFDDVGTSETAITDIQSQYDRQVIFKEERSYYSTAEAITFPDGTTEYEYPIHELNDEYGNEAFGQVRLVNNYPVSLSHAAIRMWTNTQVKDERNQKNVSVRIEQSLRASDLSQAVTYDWKRNHEYMVCIGDEVYVWNYENDTFYKFTNVPAQQFFEYQGQLYFTTAGAVKRFEDYRYNDDGVAIEAVMELSFTHLGIIHLMKSIREIWVSIVPYDNTSMKILYRTNKKVLQEEDAIEVMYNLATFTNVDFSNFSFETNVNPEPFRRKIRAKKFSYIKFLFKNTNLDEPLTILNLVFYSETNGEVKK